MTSAAVSPAYDYIVVGAGSGGCAVVRRLIDRTDARVLLIEAGEATWDAAEIEDPTRWVPLAKSRWDWGYDYAPTPAVNGRVIPIPRGKGLGGSSAINAMMWYRGHPADYDAWEAAGAAGWSFSACLPYFKRCEDWQGGESPWRGAGGPLRVETSPDLHPIARAMIDGASQIGIPVIGDPNGASNEGAALSNFNIAGGKRWSAATGYLLPVRDAPNLTILTGSHAIGLVVERGRCIGVRHRVAGGVVETWAENAVILALGAIDTPRLLTLSGLAAPGDLKRLGIPVKADLPGVGQNLQDHPLIRALNFRARGPLGPPRDNGGGSMINWRSDPSQARPDLHAFPVQGRSAVPRLLETHDLTGDLFAIGTGLMRSKSIGYLRVLEGEPGGRLAIQPNFLQESDDVDALVRAMEIIFDLVATPAFAPFMAGLAAPARRLDRQECVAFVRESCSTFFHTCGTARMGTDAMAVVDPRLHVRGVDGLMIADASVIPVIPSCNTHAPVTMIGERAADFLLGAA